MKELKISDSHIDQIEHLLVQSMNGIHLLFDNDTIREILKNPTEKMDFFHQRNMEKIEELFTQFIHRKTFEEKRLFLQSLDRASYEVLLRTYFYIVDNSLQSEEGRH